jgi:periplasmic protein TonB
MPDLRFDSFSTDFDDEPPPGFLRRNRIVLCLIAVMAALAGAVAHQLSLGKSSRAPEPPELTMVHPIPLPPPPPPPPPKRPPPPQQQTMTPQEKVVDAKPPEPKEAPAPVIGTGIKGNGASGMGVGAADSGSLFGKGGGGGGGGSRWGWWASGVQTKVASALRNNPHTRDASVRMKVRIWADRTGRVTRASLAATTGDHVVDAAVQNEVLVGLQLQEPPPEGMPMPVVMTITGTRPN